MDTSTVIDVCPHCQTKIKSNLLSSVHLLSERQTSLINEYVTIKQEGYCSKCGDKLYIGALAEWENEIKDLSQKIRDLLPLLPVVTLQNPAGWEYSVVDIVTAQSTMGTGVFMEFASSFSDMLGNESGSYNRKIKIGENNCILQLRIEALKIGANAIIGVDIDYSDIGGAKSMIMVCMAGTAIKLKNMNIINEKLPEKINQLIEYNNRISHVKSLIVIT